MRKFKFSQLRSKLKLDEINDLMLSDNKSIHLFLF